MLLLKRRILGMIDDAMHMLVMLMSKLKTIDFEYD